MKGELSMKKDRRSETNVSSGGVLLGMAAGAALGMAGTMMVTQNPRQVRRNARRLAKGAEKAICQLDEMVGDFVEKKMDL